jgi:hypothetical protein
MKINKLFAIGIALLYSAASFAQASNGTITNGTQSQAQQATNVDNVVNLPGGGNSEIGYSGSYTVKSAPTVYAPSLTASVTETCWGSISGAVSVVGVGVTAAATIKDYDCNRRLTAGVDWRMGRQDVAFNLMCQDDEFKAAAALTDKPCPSNTPIARQGTEIVPMALNAEDAKKHGNLVSDKPVATDKPNVVQDLTTGQMQYKVAEAPPAAAK